MDRVARRYAPMSRDHIPHFPNKISKVDWSRNLPTFKDDGMKDTALHLVRFHMHIRKLKVDFPEDCLMKIFLATLEGKAQSWYEIFPPSCIYCLEDFHAMFIERYKDSYPSLNLFQDCCKHAYSFIESLEKFYEDDNFMDEEVMEALYENPFQQHTEILEDICQDQQAEDFHMVENDERENVVSDLSIEEDSMQVTQESNDPISESDDDKSDREINCDEAKHVVPDLIKESCIITAASNEENGVADLNALISPALDLHEEVVHFLCEKQDKIFVQVSEKVSLDESMVADRNVSVGFHKTSEISFLMIDECNENLAIISYEDDLPYIPTTKDQTIQDSISDSSSYVSCFEMLFQEEICSSTCSEFFEDQEHTLSGVHDEGRSESREKDTLLFQQEERLHVF